jgi:multidrug efflux pump subunit AcrB
VSGPIAWFARNRVAANLLMLLILVSGLLTLTRIREEVFPEFDVDVVTVSVAHPGAAPVDVEEGICVRIEEELQGLDGVKRITSTAAEGLGVVTVELLRDADPRKVLDDVKARVDAIDTLPDEAESPIVQQPVLRKQVLNVAVHGDADERTLKAVGERVRDDVAALPGITQVELANAREHEIAIEVSEVALQRWGLTFDDVAAAVRRGSLDLPGGQLRTRAGEILLRTKGQALRGPDFESLVLLTRPDGTRLLLGDVARVVDGFDETERVARFDGEPTVLVQVFRVGEQSALDVSRAVREYVASAQAGLPEGLRATVWQDDAEILRSRLDTLVRNGRSGLILVFLVLALFLRLRLALWVSLGVPVAFLGAIALLPLLDISLNLLSLFGFIVVLGIVVDDAIVVAENIHAHRERGKSALRAAIDGSLEVSTPVTFAVLTSVVAFLPMAFVPGTTGKIWRVIPIIVIACLLFSLIESKLILPAHLSRGLGRPQAPGRGIAGAWRRFQSGFAGLVERSALNAYRPSLERALRWRYATVAGSFALFLLTVGFVGGGWVKLVFMPPVEADFVFANLSMPQGTPVETTEQAVARLEAAARELAAEIDGSEPGGGTGVFRHVLASVGEQPERGAHQANGGGLPGSFVGAHLGEVTIELAPSEARDVTSAEVARRWRERVGEIPGALELELTSDLFSAGEALNVQLMGPDLDELQAVASELKARLAARPGVVQVADSFRAGKQEARLRVRPEAEALGLSQAVLARQVRQAFHGEEAQRVQRGRDEVKVMVRYPRSGRSSLEDLEGLRVRTAGGAAVPFGTVARAEIGRGHEAIRRADRRRAINVTAEVEGEDVNANEVSAWVTGAVLPEILAEHPRVTWSLEGERREQADVLGGLFRGFGLALFAIYALMAIPFKSYLQPLVVMSAIPLGLVGAVGGHVIMGHDLSVLSLCGMVALAGVVVNDSLVLVDHVNRRRREGVEVMEALRTAGVARFRPILITSLTTFAGLTPLMLERSMQAQFLVPMAISLAFGVVFATFISLVLVPSLYAIMEDLVAAADRLVGGRLSRADGEESAPAPAA